MSEKDYITLLYDEDEKNIDIPKNFIDLKAKFCEKFDVEESENYKFSYQNEDDEESIKENNFNEAIEIIKKNDRCIIYVEDDNKVDEMRKGHNFSVQIKKEKNVELKRQNAIKNSSILTSQGSSSQYLIGKAIEEKNNDKDNNLEKNFDDYENNCLNSKEKNNNSNSTSNNNTKEDGLGYLRVNSNKVLKESSVNSLELNDLKEKEKEIEELKRVINELKENSNKKVNEYNELSQTLNEEKDKNINTINNLQKQLKEAEEKLQLEQNAKNKIINEKNKIESENKTLEKQVSEYQSLNESSKINNNHIINELKEKNKELINTNNNLELELGKVKQQLEDEKKQNKSNNEISSNNQNIYDLKYKSLQNENEKLKEELENLNKDKEDQIKNEQSKIKILEEKINDLENEKNKNKEISSLKISLNKNNMSNINRSKLNRKKQNKLDFINKRFKENSEIILKQNDTVNKENIIQEENQYKENYINIMNDLIQKSKLNQIQNKDVEKNRIQRIAAEKNRNQNNIVLKISNNNNNNNELIKLKKQIEENNNMLEEKNKEIKNLNMQLNKEKNNKIEIEEIEKERENYQKQINEIKSQLIDKDKQINENNNKLNLITKNNNESELKLKQYQNELENQKKLLNENQQKFNELFNQKQNYENVIKQLRYENEQCKKELSKNDVLKLEQKNKKEEYDLKKKEYREILEKKYEELYQQSLKKAIYTINENIESQKKELQKKYENNFIYMQNNYAQKFSQISNLMQQSLSNINKCKTKHEGIKCNNCYKCPIVGYRYKCSKCTDFNLCEDCEEKNYESNAHPHIFLKIRNHIPKKNDEFNMNRFEANNNVNKFDNNKNNQNIDFKLLNKNNNKDDNDFQILNFEKEELYAFSCVNKHNLKVEINEGDDKAIMEIIIKNNGSKKWPEKKAKLVFNERKNLIGRDVILQPQNPKEQQKYQIIFDNLNPYPSGEYKAGLIFEVDEKMYGDELELLVVIKEKQKIIEDKNENNHAKVLKEFRDSYGLTDNTFSDEKLLDVLQKHNFNFVDAFTSLFD